jgi:hypothetical protein
VEFLARFLWHVLPKGLRRIRRFGWWGNAVRTQKLTLLRRLLGVRPAEPREPADTATDTLPEEMPEETPDEELLRLEAEQRAPRKCRVCGGKLELLYQTGRPTVAELLRMPPSMELLVETGPVQLHLPISAFCVTLRRAARRPTACGDGCFSGRRTSGAPGALPPRETPPTLPPLCHTGDCSTRCLPPFGRAPHSRQP